jgi:hypothetical protein
LIDVNSDNGKDFAEWLVTNDYITRDKLTTTTYKGQGPLQNKEVYGLTLRLFKNMDEFTKNGIYGKDATEALYKQFLSGSVIPTSNVANASPIDIFG